MPATAATLVRRQKRMRIWLQARQHILTLRSNLRFPQTMLTKADTCRKPAVLRLPAAGRDTEPYSIAAQRWVTSPQLHFRQKIMESRPQIQRAKNLLNSTAKPCVNA